MSSPKSCKAQPPIVLVANNPYGHHLLTSQLLDIYHRLGLDPQVTLVCNGFMSESSDSQSNAIRMFSYASSHATAFTYLNLVRRLRWIQRTNPAAVFHIRGFVSGVLFWISRLGMLRTSRYLYDPRGAFFIEWGEAGRSRWLGRLYRWIESLLVHHSVATIVTSRRFAELYQRHFGSRANLCTIYNSTSFEFNNRATHVPPSGPVRVVYLGTFNYWHDMDEIARIMSEAANQIGPDRVQLFVFTLPKFHQTVKERFGTIDCADLTVAYIPYERLPEALADKHIGVSVVRPTPSTRIASPIKVADYVALGLVPLLNADIGDFDDHFEGQKSAIVYPYGGPIDLSGIASISTARNRKIYDQVSLDRASAELAPLLERLRNG